MLGLAGYFFDGTGNDMIDGETAPTHVQAIFEAYTKSRVYIAGVGTKGNGHKILGGASGRGARARLDTMFLEFEKQYKSGDKEIDIFGFSRGAAMAREFSNMIAEKYPDAQIRFLGIFDTVAQIGLPDYVNNNPGIRLDIPDNVVFTAHAVAKNEYRALFPLTSVAKAYGSVFNYKPAEYQIFSSKRFVELGFQGAHADVGGGYDDGGNRHALNFVMRAAQIRGVPLDKSKWTTKQKKFYETFPANNKWHDSRKSGTGTPDLWGLERNNRRIYSGNLEDFMK